MGFNYGADVTESGGDFKNPEVGIHEARIRSIIHLGLFEAEYLGKKKKPANQVVVVFELKGDDDKLDDGSPMQISKDFALRSGDKSYLTKFMKALDPKGESSGFEDFIGKPCMLDIKAGKKLNDDGTPKFVNAGDVTAMAPKLAKITEELQVPGVGHVEFKDLTKEAIMELSPRREVNMILEQTLSYPGSGAEKIVMEIRKENPEFGLPKKTDDDSGGKGAPAASSEPSTPPPDLDEEESF